MRFIIDGEGNVSRAAALALLKDIIKPYSKPVFIMPYVIPSTGDLGVVHNQADLMANAGLCAVVYTTDIQSELMYDQEKIFIVLGADTRKHQVIYCLENHIQVLDLEKGLYPVTSLEELC